MTDIADKMTDAALLELLAEECTELAHTALKLARIKRGENPTPVTASEATEHLKEEFTDVILCANVADLEIDPKTYNSKLSRWRHRLGIESEG